MRAVLSLIVVAGCRYNINDLPPADADFDGDVDSDADTASRVLQINVTGRGAVRSTFGICTSQCTGTVPAGDVTLEAYGANTWSLATSSMCNGTSCVVPANVASIDVTFVQAIPAANLAFITSIVTSTTMGRAAFDTTCQTLATQATFLGTFVAFVSTTTEDARDRLTGSRGWVRMDGMPVFDQPTDIGSLGLPRAILFDETGTARHGENVATGSEENGTESVDTCGNWTTTSQQITNGFASAGADWMLGGWHSGCPSTALTYCLQVGRNVAVDVDGPPFPVGRRIFVSRGKPGTTGVSGADAICQAEADAANLVGTFRALLATTSETGVERLGSIAGPWRRTDDVLVTLDGLDSRSFDAAILTDAAGAVHTANVHFGAADLNTRADLAENCNDWTTTGGFVSVLTPKLAALFDESLGGACGNESVLCAELP